MTERYLNLDEAENYTQLALEAVQGSDTESTATYLATVCLTLAELLIRAASEGDSEKA